MSGTKDNVSIIVIVNNSLLRDGLSHILSGEGYKVVASASVLDADILSRLNPDESSLLVLGGSADRKDTAEQLKLYREQQQNGCSVIIAERDEPDDIIMALKAGANACLTKDTTSDAFLKTIELVMLGDTVVPHALLPHLLKRDDAFASGMARDNAIAAPNIEVAPSARLELKAIDGNSTAFRAGKPNSLLPDHWRRQQDDRAESGYRRSYGQGSREGDIAQIGSEKPHSGRGMGAEPGFSCP